MRQRCIGAENLGELFLLKTTGFYNLFVYGYFKVDLRSYTEA